jgi:hypothetical protein
MEPEVGNSFFKLFTDAVMSTASAKVNLFGKQRWLVWSPRATPFARDASVRRYERAKPCGSTAQRTAPSAIGLQTNLLSRPILCIAGSYRKVRKACPDGHVAPRTNA